MLDLLILLVDQLGKALDARLRETIVHVVRVRDELPELLVLNPVLGAPLTRMQVSLAHVALLPLPLLHLLWRGRAFFEFETALGVFIFWDFHLIA